MLIGSTTQSLPGPPTCTWLADFLGTAKHPLLAADAWDTDGWGKNGLGSCWFMVDPPASVASSTATPKIFRASDWPVSFKPLISTLNQSTRVCMRLSSSETFSALVL